MAPTPPSIAPIPKKTGQKSRQILLCAHGNLSYTINGPPKILSKLQQQ